MGSEGCESAIGNGMYVPIAVFSAAGRRKRWGGR